MAEDAIDKAVAGDEGVAVDEGQGGKLKPVLLGAVIVVGAAVLGVVASMFLAKPPAEATAGPAKPAISIPDSPAEVYEYYDLDQVLVNANVPQRNRYIKAHVTLAFHPDVLGQAQRDLDATKPEVQSWLTGYLSGLTLEDVGGPRNLSRICQEIQDELNHRLWPDQGPVIHHVLMKEFAVQ